MTETAKANNLHPFLYLKYILMKLKERQDDTDYSFIHNLPLRLKTLPDICRSRSKTTNV
ncbi:MULTISPECIES: transposase domain-containing protein [Blautia]|uniref:transposase domain-containing protein n=1 Tax=Blautia TaxID=572511 RepID=UPI0038BA82D5